jgi:hypothetical protein
MVVPVVAVVLVLVAAAAVVVVSAVTSGDGASCSVSAAIGARNVLCSGSRAHPFNVGLLSGLPRYFLAPQHQPIPDALVRIVVRPMVCRPGLCVPCPHARVPILPMCLPMSVHACVPVTSLRLHASVVRSISTLCHVQQHSAICTTNKTRLVGYSRHAGASVSPSVRCVRYI